MTGRGARRRDRRTHRIPVRFTYQELATARQRAHKSGRSLARYLREAALVHAPRPLRLQTHNNVVHVLSTIVRKLDREPSDDPTATIAEAIISLRTLLTRLAT